jgi:hypothetical protein
MPLPNAPKDNSDQDLIVKADKDTDVDRKVIPRAVHILVVHTYLSFRFASMASSKPSAKDACLIISRSTRRSYMSEILPPVEIDKLSPESPKLIQDARDIVETARLMVQEKNADGLFQNFVWHTRGVDVSGEEGSR